MPRPQENDENGNFSKRNSIDFVNSLKTQTFENEGDVSPSPLAFKKQRWRISTENVLLFLLVPRSY